MIVRIAYYRHGRPKNKRILARGVRRPKVARPKAARPKQRWIAFLGSLAIHGGLVAALALVPAAPVVYTSSPGYARNPFAPKYTLTIIHLQAPAADRPTAASGERAASRKQTPRQERKQQATLRTPAPRLEPHALIEPPAPRESRPFVPPSALPVPANLPEPLVEISPAPVGLPEAKLPLLSSNLPVLRAPTRQFVAPSAADARKNQQSPPAAPLLVDAPSVEIASGSSSLMPMFVDDFARVIRVPVAPAPNAEPVGTPPGRGGPPSSTSNATRDRAGARSDSGAAKPGSPGVQGISVSGNLPGVNTVAGVNGSTGGSSVQDLAGLSRIVQPANGKFAVVIQGSPDSTRYPASAGILPGSVINTVYLRLGTRRNWVMQYALSRDEGGPGMGGSPIEAPWPLTMMRLDAISSQPSYVLVHGKITAAGDFDQLSMVFPANFDKSEPLLKSLKMWKFRPAGRDGQAVAVEVLLIIPQQTN